MSVDAGGNIIPKTPLATIVATQTYLLATQGLSKNFSNYYANIIIVFNSLNLFFEHHKKVM
jgi:hypothetical protein